MSDYDSLASKIRPDAIMTFSDQGGFGTSPVPLEPSPTTSDRDLKDWILPVGLALSLALGAFALYLPMIADGAAVALALVLPAMIAPLGVLPTARGTLWSTMAFGLAPLGLLQALALMIPEIPLDLGQALPISLLFLMAVTMLRPKVRSPKVLISALTAPVFLAAGLPGVPESWLLAATALFGGIGCWLLLQATAQHSLERTVLGAALALVMLEGLLVSLLPSDLLLFAADIALVLIGMAVLQAVVLAPNQAETARRTLLDQLPVPLLEVSQGGTVISANAAADGLLLPESGLLDRLGVAPETMEARRLVDALRDGGRTEALVLPGSSGRQWQVTIGRPVTGDTVLLLVEDVAETLGREKLLQAETDAAVKADREKTAMLALSSHELRTPLNAVIGFAEMLKSADRLKLQAVKRAEYAGLIHSAGEHLLSIVNRILDLTRLESFDDAVEAERIDLCALVEMIARTHQAVAGKAKIVLDYVLVIDRLMVSADPVLMREAVENLVGNALKFTPEGGHVIIRVGCSPSGRAEIAVIDDGPGIPVAERSRVLRPFGRGGTPDVRMVEGTGLGLPLVDSVAKRHGGGFTLASGPKGGLTATIAIPAAGPVER